MTGRKVPISDLGQFFGSYFHQDWVHEYPDAWSAVEAYVSETPLPSRRAARLELVELLRTARTESELGDATERVHLNFYPAGVGTTYRAWLTKVEQYLADHES